jgi:hypothetical protein
MKSERAEDLRVDLAVSAAPVAVVVAAEGRNAVVVVVIEIAGHAVKAVHRAVRARRRVKVRLHGMDSRHATDSGIEIEIRDDIAKLLRKAEGNKDNVVMARARNKVALAAVNRVNARKAKAAARDKSVGIVHVTQVAVRTAASSVRTPAAERIARGAADVPLRVAHRCLQVLRASGKRSADSLRSCLANRTAP